MLQATQNFITSQHQGYRTCWSSDNTSTQKTYNISMDLYRIQWKVYLKSIVTSIATSYQGLALPKSWPDYWANVHIQPYQTNWENNSNWLFYREQQKPLYSMESKWRELFSSSKRIQMYLCVNKSHLGQEMLYIIDWKGCRLFSNLQRR